MIARSAVAWSRAAQAVDVAAVNQATNFSFAGGLAGGIAGIAGGVDVGLLKNSTVAYIGSDVDVNAQQDVDVFALSNDSRANLRDRRRRGGLARLVGSVSVWSIGEAYSPDYSYTDGTGTSDNKTVASLGNNSGVTTDELERGRPDRRRVVDGLRNDQPDLNGGAGNTDSTSAARSNSAQSGFNDAVTAAIRSPPHSRAQQRPPQGTVAFIGIPRRKFDRRLARHRDAGGNVNVQAQSEVSYTAVTGGLSVGSVGIGASVEIANIQGSTQAYIDAASTVSAGGNVTVDAVLANDTSNGTAFAGTAGEVAALGAQVVDIEDSSTETASLGNGVTIASPAVAGHGVGRTAR